MKHSARPLGAMLALPLLLAGAGAAIAAAPADHAPQTFMSDVARHLGVPEQKLKDAITRTRLDRVRGLLREGRITISQAAEMERAIKAGRPTMWMHHRGRAWGKAVVGDAASYLGMTPEVFVQRLRDGQSPAVIAKAQGKTPAGLEQALLQAAQKRIASDVQAGRLTAAQAASVQQRLPAHIHRFVSGGWHRARPVGPPPPPAPAPAAQP